MIRNVRFCLSECAHVLVQNRIKSAIVDKKLQKLQKLPGLNLKLQHAVSNVSEKRAMQREIHGLKIKNKR